MLLKIAFPLAFGHIYICKSLLIDFSESYA